MACRQLVAWRAGPLRKHESFQLSVNVSARQLAEPGLVGHVNDKIRELGIEPSWLHLEVTKTALVTDVEASRPGR
jgi:EAL domain-containing protein (putative c-di-GMP-specific phosphodiesterase class I)